MTVQEAKISNVKIIFIEVFSGWGYLSGCSRVIKVQIRLNNVFSSPWNSSDINYSMVHDHTVHKEVINASEVEMESKWERW